MKELTEFHRGKDFLFCVDSDGCAIDGMTVKHLECFGPCIIEEWGLEEYQEELQKEWNRINLHSMDRGINRFKGLLKELEYAAEKGYLREEISQYREWVEHTREWSNESLKAEIENQKTGPAGDGDESLRKALEWSEAVNRAVAFLPPEKKLPFAGVKECLAMIHEYADIAVISSANRAAVLEEWEENGLLGLADAVLTQEYGGKADCIKKMKAYGFEEDNILMAGDAPGDADAAKKNGVLFYPIMAGRETVSWKELQEQVLQLFLQGSYRGRAMEGWEQKFVRNLGKPFFKGLQP